MGKNRGKDIWSNSGLKHIFRILGGDNWHRWGYVSIMGISLVRRGLSVYHILLHVNMIVPLVSKEYVEVLIVLQDCISLTIREPEAQLFWAGMTAKQWMALESPETWWLKRGSRHVRH